MKSKKSKIIAEIVFNLHYAAKMHEERGKTWKNLGPRSIAEGPSGEKFMSKHFTADGKEFFKQLADDIEKGINKFRP